MFDRSNVLLADSLNSPDVHHGSHSGGYCVSDAEDMLENKVVVICSNRSRNWSADPALFHSSVGRTWLFQKSLLNALGFWSGGHWPKTHEYLASKIMTNFAASPSPTARVKVPCIFFESTV